MNELRYFRLNRPNSPIAIVASVIKASWFESQIESGVFLECNKKGNDLDAMGEEKARAAFD